jgi:hypothetical protein
MISFFAMRSLKGEEQSGRGVREKNGLDSAKVPEKERQIIRTNRGAAQAKRLRH